jgi:hypothetical protein
MEAGDASLLLPLPVLYLEPFNMGDLATYEVDLFSSAPLAALF